MKANAPREVSLVLAGYSIVLAFVEPNIGAGFALAAAWLEFLEYVADRDEREAP